MGVFHANGWGSKIRVRQRSDEGVVRRNGCPKGCFWRVRFFSAPLRFALKTPEIKPENLKGAEKKRTLQKHPFGQPFLRTTPSPLLWRAPRKARSSVESLWIRFETKSLRMALLRENNVAVCHVRVCKHWVAGNVVDLFVQLDINHMIHMFPDVFRLRLHKD